jgi:acetyl esterase/lipase
MLTANMNPEWIDFSAPMPMAKIDHVTRKFMEIPYGDHEKQHLDIYLPESGEGPFPVVINIHGGGFTHCDKRDFHLYPTFYALKEGFAVAAVNYRLSPEVRFPEHIYDVKAAVRWIAANAAGYGLDAGNLFLWGTSAGGNLVAIVGATCNTGALDQHEDAGKITGIRAVAAMCPAINLASIRSQLIQNEQTPLMEKLLDEMMLQYFGTEPSVELLEKSNPESYVTDKTPPFYLQHGAMDPIVPLEQSLLFSNVLKKRIGEDNVVMDILEGAVHAGGGPDFFLEKNIYPVIDFYKRFIKK